MAKDFSIVEELWFGDFDDDDARKKAENSFVAVYAKAHGLRPFPATAAKLASMARDPDYRPAELVKVIETDASLATRVLSVVNSAAYQMSKRCTSLNHAVSLLGARNISAIATAVATLQMFDGRASSKGLRDHCNVVGSLARHLGPLCDGVNAEELYVCGLLHDLGKLLLMELPQPHYEDLLSTHTDADSLHVAEREMYGYDHAVLAGHLLNSWGIPEPIPAIVSWHHQSGRAMNAGEEIAKPVQVIRLADRLAHAAAASEPFNDALAQQFAQTEAASYLELSQTRLSELWPQVRDVVAEYYQLNVDDEAMPSARQDSHVSVEAVPAISTDDSPDEFPQQVETTSWLQNRIGAVKRLFKG